MNSNHGSLDCLQQEDLANLANPECSTDVWWALAQTYPVHAIASPLYSLLTLETPERWFAMEAQCLGRWIKKYVYLLSPRQQDAYAAACAAHVLHLWMEKEPTDKRPQKAIAARRRLARHGETARPQWEACAKAAADAYDKLPRRTTGGGHDEAGEAAKAAAADDLVTVVVCAAYAMALQAIRNHPARWDLSRSEYDQIFRAASRKECLWQWARLRQYLQKEIS